MEGVIHHELELGLACFLHGIFLMAAYDVLRIFRRVIRHNIIAVSIEDILFWTVCTAVTFELLRIMNHGIFRYSIVLMSASGMLLYYLLLGKYAVPLIARLLNKVKQILKKWKTLLTAPIKKAMIKVYRCTVVKPAMRVKRLLLSAVLKNSHGTEDKREENNSISKRKEK